MSWQNLLRDVLISSLLFPAVVCDGTTLKGRQQQEEERRCPKLRLWPSPSKYILEPSGQKFLAVSCMAFSEDQHTVEGNSIAWVAHEGYQTSIHAVDFMSGKLIVSIELENVNKMPNPDWQSVALGPCSSSVISPTCIYLGNLGNTEAHGCADKECELGRQAVEIYKFREPDIQKVLANNYTYEPVVTMLVNYTHPSFALGRNDAQTLFVDWHGDTAGGMPGDIYIVTKNPNNSRGSTIAKIPASKHQHLSFGDTADIRLQAVGNPHHNLLSIDGAMSSKDRLIAIRTLDYVYFFPRTTSQTVVDALEQPPCEFAGITPQGLPNENSFHTVTFVGDPLFVVETSQCYTRGEACEVVSYVYQLLFDDEEVKPPDTSAWTAIEQDQFTDGLGWEGTNFENGGVNVDFGPLGITDQANIGISVRIKGNNGVSSSLLSNADIDFSTYEQVMVRFWLHHNGLDVLEGYFLECSSDGGISWCMAHDWATGINMSNMTASDRFVEEFFIFKRTNGFPMTDNMRIRFRSNLKDPSHEIFIADIQISGTVEVASS